MKRFADGWTRFGDGWWYGLTVAVIVVLALSVSISWVYSKGVDSGRHDERVEIERQGGGRYLDVQLDGRRYAGWLIAK